MSSSPTPPFHHLFSRISNRIDASVSLVLKFVNARRQHMAAKDYRLEDPILSLWFENISEFYVNNLVIIFKRFYYEIEFNLCLFTILFFF